MDTISLVPKSILVVEDDHIMLKAISNILHKGGYNVLPAKDAKEAFELVDSAAYDIIITDLLLPYANGLEVVRRVRKDYSKKNIGIIVISSMTQEDVVSEAYNLGADDYFKKPIMAHDLLLRITKLLTSKSLNNKTIKAAKPVAN
jgi:two-component system response regulator VicR